MVGIMNPNWADRAASLLNSATSSGKTPSKMKQLWQLRELLLLHLDPSLLTIFIPKLSVALQADRASPVRNYLAELIGVIGTKHTELVPAMVPTLISLLKDETPAVARQAIATGTILFRLVLEKVVVDKLDDSLKSCWEWMLSFKDSVLPIAIQSGNDGVRLLAVKFVEAMVLLYTPDPNGDLQGFNISSVRRGHPLLDVADLSMEASQSLTLLLDQLRFPNVRSLSNSMITVLTNCLSAIAQRRPSFYGRIVPVLLGLDPASSVFQGVQVPGAHQALKNALLACWKCTHPSAEPWRPRLIEALKAMDAGGLVEETYGLNNISESIVITTEVHPDIGRKRRYVEDNNDSISRKRIRSSEEPLQTVNGSTQNNLCLIGSFASTGDGSLGSIQQLVDAIGALVAQGEKAANSLEILTSSISPDLLVEVVMSNLRHLPPTCPKSERGEAWESLSVVQPSHTVSDNFSLSNAFPLIASLLNVQPIASHNIVEESRMYEVDKVTKAGTSCISYTVTDSVAVIPTGNQASISLNLTEKQKDISTNEMQGVEQERAITFRSTLPLNVSSSSCMPNFNSETLSPSKAVVDESQEPSTTSPVILNRITDEQKDQQLKAAFVRILKAHKQIAISDRSKIHLSLLANLGINFPSELDSWGLLQKHIICNYVNHEGHELILHVLYRLYQEMEQDKDLLSSRAATSVYESFLLAVTEALRNTFPASDKSLGKLLVEVPYLSEGVLKLVECLCSLEESVKDGNSFQNGDRVTQGLSIVWNLILLRPSNQDRCLQIALESAVHHRDEVRTKAIRLVTNKLFPVASISKKIEDFAIEKLHSAVNITQMDLDDGSVLESESPFSEARRCMSLYFALCTKKQSLLLRIFTIYQTLPKGSKEAVHSQVPVLVPAIRSSHELFDIIAAPPVGSEDLLIQVLQTLTNIAVPSQNLILSIRRLCESRPKDVHVLIPVLQFLSKDEVISIFPQFVNLPLDKFQAALTHILQGTIQTGSSLTPAEVLIAIHDIDSQRDGVPLRKVIDACSACFEQRSVFTEQVLAKVLNQLVEQIPLPLLFMRTVIHVISLYPALMDFVMEILSKLVRKQIWKFPKLWVGFLKCVLQTMPQSFSVILKLPSKLLENALNKNPVLRAPLVEHANLPNIRSSLPQSTLLVLGLVNDPRDSTGQSQAQRNHGQDADTGSFAADIDMEKTLQTMAVS